MSTVNKKIQLSPQRPKLPINLTPGSFSSGGGIRQITHVPPTLASTAALQVCQPEFDLMLINMCLFIICLGENKSASLLGITAT